MKTSLSEKSPKIDSVANLDYRVKHPEREPPLIETKIARLPRVRVILRFVAIQQLEVVTGVEALVDEPHQSCQ